MPGMGSGSNDSLLVGLFSFDSSVSGCWSVALDLPLRLVLGFEEVSWSVSRERSAASVTMSVSSSENM